MRLRRRKKKVIDITPETIVTERDEEQEPDNEGSLEETGHETGQEPKKEKKSKKPAIDKTKKLNSSKDKPAKPLDAPGSLFRRIIQNPNFNSQLMVIIFSLLSDNVQMNRPLENMTSAIDKVRNISDVLNNTMQSVKVAADVPKQIRRLLK